MKRFIYTAVAGAILAVTGSNQALADGKDDKVLMCQDSHKRGQREILVNAKDIARHLAKGDTLGSCQVIAEPE